VFFTSSNTQSFASDEVRAAFRERWLGRYLEYDAHCAWLAMALSGDVAGYVVGAIDTPAQLERFEDIAYFKTFAHELSRYPAHLHVNLLEAFRGRGIGEKLIGAFATDARDAGASGMHVVTGADMRNVGFYARNGFAEVARSGEGERAIVMLGRKLTFSD
jgi:GNAT superfamily N-acetyltransferase